MSLFFFVLFSVIPYSFVVSCSLFLLLSQQTILFAIINLLEKCEWNLFFFFLGQRYHAIVLNIAENASSNLCMPQQK